MMYCVWLLTPVLILRSWGVAVEKAIGNLFSKFIVHDSHDANVIRPCQFALLCSSHSCDL